MQQGQREQTAERGQSENLAANKIQAHIKLSKNKLYRYVITCGDPARAAVIASYLQEAKCLAQNREYHSYFGYFDQVPILVCSHGVGASGALICFEELIQVGAELIIRLGTAGTLLDQGTIGDILVATSAVREEGVSAYLAPPSFPAQADFDLTAFLWRKCQSMAREFNPQKGVVVSNANYYPSSIFESNLSLLKQCGAIGAEMECATLFILAQIKGIKAASILVADGNPLKWQEGMFDPSSDRAQKAMQKAISTTLAALVDYVRHSGDFLA